MEDCDSPLHSIVFVITEHSENLYKTVYNVKRLSEEWPASDDDEMNIPSSEVDSLCWCAVDQ